MLSLLQRVLNPSRRFYLLLFCAMACVYTSVQNAGYLDVSDADDRLETYRAIVERGSLLFPTHWVPKPHVALQSIGPVVAALPFLGVGEILDRMEVFSVPRRQLLVRCLLASSIFYTALWVCAIAALAVRFRATHSRALAIALVCGLATLIFPYSKTFQSENLVGLGATAIVLLLYGFRTEGCCWRVLCAGLVYGLLLATKFEIILTSPLLGFYLFVCAQSRPGATQVWKLAGYGSWFTLGCVPGLTIMLLYNYGRYGNPWQSGYESYGFTYPFLSGLYLNFISSGKGLLWYCPVLLFTLSYTSRFARKFPEEAILMFGWWAALTVLYSMWWNPVGDTSLGPRFMVSYLAFAVLPIVVIRWNRVSITFRVTGALLLVLSMLLQFLHSAVSYVHYHSTRWNNAPDKFEARMMTMEENRYIPSFSPLIGNWETLQQGLLDMFFVRNRPSEDTLTILPPFWFLLAGFCALLVFVYISVRSLDGIRPISRYSKWALATPALILATCGAAGVKAPRGEGLLLTYERPDWGRHITWARAIDIPDIQAGQDYNTVGCLKFKALWAGWFRTKIGGMHVFAIDSNNTATLQIAEREFIRVTPAKPVVQRGAYLSPGWHTIRVTYEQLNPQGKLHVRWKAPGEAKFRSLRSASLRHEQPE